MTGKKSIWTSCRKQTMISSHQRQP